MEEKAAWLCWEIEQTGVFRPQHSVTQPVFLTVVRMAAYGSRVLTSLRKSLFVLLAATLPNVVLSAEDTFEERVRAYILSNPEIIVEALTILSERERAAELEARIATHTHLFEKSSVLGIGLEDAPIRVIEFFDYKCAPCKALHPSLMHAVAQNPELRIEMRHLPILTPASERAARFALAVREIALDTEYRRVHKRLWAQTGPLNADFFKSIAQEEGLDYAKIEALMYSDAVTDRIATHRDSAIALEIIGTPAFVTPKSVSVGPGDMDALLDSWLSQ